MVNFDLGDSDIIGAYQKSHSTTNVITFVLRDLLDIGPDPVFDGRDLNLIANFTNLSELASRRDAVG